MTYPMPVTITFRDIEETDAIRNRIMSKAEKLTRYFDQIEYCKVTLETSQRHKHQGKLFVAKIECGVPNKTLAVTHKQDEDLYVSLRDAFNAMRRQLQHHRDSLRGDVKHHPEHLTGQIVRLFGEYGFIEAADGREFYFNSDVLVNQDIAKLDIGDHVQFTESVTDDGLNANHVSVE